MTEEKSVPKLEIIGVPQSNYVWVVGIACHEKGVPYTLVPVVPHAPEVDAIHPLGKIPALRHGNITLAESRAICFYIDRVFSGTPLVSRDAVEGGRRPSSGFRSDPCVACFWCTAARGILPKLLHRIWGESGPATGR
jgi:hypothetical protein